MGRTGTVVKLFPGPVVFGDIIRMNSPAPKFFLVVELEPLPERLAQHILAVVCLPGCGCGHNAHFHICRQGERWHASGEQRLHLGVLRCLALW